MKKKKIIYGLLIYSSCSFGKSVIPASQSVLPEEESQILLSDESQVPRIKFLTKKPAFGSRISVVPTSQQTGAHSIDQIEDDYDYKPNTVPPFIEKALAWLAEAQHEDGTWGAGSNSRQQIRDPHAVQGDPATTSFAAMAFLRSGQTTQKGKYKDVVRKATEALVKVVENAPVQGPKITQLSGTQPQAKMGQFVDTSLTARFLARILNELPKKSKLRKRVDKAIDKCVAKIQASQQKDGSWTGGGWAPVLQSSLAEQALEIAQAAGKEIDEDVLKRARENQKGNFDDRSGKVRADKAAGIELYAFAGAQRATASETLEANDIVEKAKKEGKLPQAAKPTVDNLRKIGVRDEKAKQLANSFAQNERQQKRVQNDNALLTGFGNNGGEEFLSYLMTSEALVITGGDAWEKWDEKMHRRMRKIQSNNGSWTGHHCITSPVFCTSAVIQCLNTFQDAETLRNASLAHANTKKEK